MPDQSMPNDGSGKNSTKVAAGNIASPVQETVAASEWQTEDFLAAEPYPLPEVSDRMVEQYMQRLLDSASQVGSSTPGGAPESGDDREQAPDRPTAGFAYPPPFNQHEVLTPYTTYPYCTVGKVFFRQNGGSWIASAASIGNNGLFTAGHVVHAGNNQPGGWSTNMVFVPAYKDGAAPFGQFTVRQLFTRTVWYQNSNPGSLYEDMGAAILNPLNGKMLSQVVGWLGFAWNFNRNQVWTSLGYPQGPPFNGQRMFQDTAAYANDGTVPGSPKPIGIGCSMTGGCSGGPWVLGFGSTNYVNGLNSYRPNDQPLEIYSPYFGENAHSLKVQVVGS